MTTAVRTGLWVYPVTKKSVLSSNLRNGYFFDVREGLAGLIIAARVFCVSTWVGLRGGNE